MSAVLRQVVFLAVFFGSVVGRHNLRDRSYRFEFGVCNIPAVEKRYKGGEDGYYASSRLLVVADGVSFWNNFGIDPAIYAKELTFHVQQNWKKSPSKFTHNPQKLMKIAYDQTRVQGSSTLVIAALDSKSKRMNISYIGDSSYMILRLNRLTGKYQKIFRSEEQQHKFNMPFQLGTNQDSPDTAINNSHLLKKGDIVVVASDGLFDNLYDRQIVKMVNQLKDRSERTIAKELGHSAFNFSLNTKYNSPFSRGARKSGMPFEGGKPDDITVIVAKVKPVNSK